MFRFKIKNSQIAFQSGCTFFIPTSNEWEFLLLHILATSLLDFDVSVLDFGHSDKCIAVSYCCFNLHFSDDIWCWTSFHMFICHLYIFFGEMSFQVLGHLLITLFIFLLLNFKSSLCIFIKVLYQMCLLQIFSPSLWLIFSFIC